MNLKNALWAATEQICESDDQARAECARIAALANPQAVTQKDREIAQQVPEKVSDLLDVEAQENLAEDAEIIAKDDTPPKAVRARFTQWITTISIWIDRSRKGDARALWLADVVDRLVRWWIDDDRDDL